MVAPFPQSLVVIRAEFAGMFHLLVAGLHRKECLAVDGARCRLRQQMHVFRFLARPALPRNNLSLPFHPPEQEYQKFKRKDRGLGRGVVVYALVSTVRAVFAFPMIIWVRGR